MTLVAHHDVEYFLEPIILRVEGTLFRIPREYIAQAAPLFLDTVLHPRPTTESGPGDAGSTSDTTPFLLPEQVKAAAFRSCIRLLLPHTSDVHLSKDEWLHVLELSDMWDMAEIKSRAIERLGSLLRDDPTYRLHLARSYSISDWIQPAVDGLIRRNPSPGKREFRLIDQETLLKIAAVRECCRLTTTWDSFSGRSRVSEVWEVLDNRGMIPVDLSIFRFTCPTASFAAPTVDEEISEVEGPRRDGEFYFEKVVFKG